MPQLQPHKDIYAIEVPYMCKDEIDNFKPLLQQYCVNGAVLKIELNEYDYTCGDGCCRNFGTITIVNGIELPCHNQDAGTILRQVLEHLGYKVEIDYGYD